MAVLGTEHNLCSSFLLGGNKQQLKKKRSTLIQLCILYVVIRKEIFHQFVRDYFWNEPKLRSEMPAFGFLEVIFRAQEGFASECEVF